MVSNLLTCVRSSYVYFVLGLLDTLEISFLKCEEEFNLGQ